MHLSRHPSRHKLQESSGRKQSHSFRLAHMLRNGLKRRHRAAHAHGEPLFMNFLLLKRTLQSREGRALQGGQAWAGIMVAGQAGWWGTAREAVLLHALLQRCEEALELVLLSSAHIAGPCLLRSLQKWWICGGQSQAGCSMSLAISIVLCNISVWRSQKNLRNRRRPAAGTKCTLGSTHRYITVTATSSTLSYPSNSHQTSSTATRKLHARHTAVKRTRPSRWQAWPVAR
jgi:hypothetical protein